MPAFKYHQRILLAVLERGHKAPRLRAFLANLPPSPNSFTPSIDRRYSGPSSRGCRAAKVGARFDLKKTNNREAFGFGSVRKVSVTSDEVAASGTVAAPHQGG